MNREQMIEVARDEISGWPIGRGYYGTQVGTNEAKEIATAVVDALLPLIEAASADRIRAALAGDVSGD